ncbi:pyridoxamine 5'-phosphate oxidase family protein [Candidatus Halobonum tyrrellensis]|uniref:Flavin-nucleotide-binding protein n=1 Tax=Candidatus Halobonum tyrrellensis G22 TaxID=1324957 RepID=V4IW88_9EURY|nr:pyridoxamine 5'-phosphate oxidase family protein [Candidatus Halobonum tyrrellensis]ESP87442.1 flavin-nucleotide-binding protein [Candidatus Halobonum tyrrellensis G22]
MDHRDDGAAVPAEAERLLTDEPLLAHLATCADGRPHVAPLWYRYEPEGETVELVTSGRKLANIRENPRVSLSVTKSDGGDPAWSVTLLGTATVVDDEAAFEAANRRINRKYGADDDAWAENTLVRIDVGSASYTTY